MKCVAILLLAGCASNSVDYAEYNYFRAIDAMQSGHALNCASKDEIFWVNPHSLIMANEQKVIVLDNIGRQHTIWRKSNSVSCIPQ